MINLSSTRDTQRIQATVVTVGLFTFICVGVLACFALVAAAFYFVVQFILYLLQAIVETFSMIGLTWVNADPFVKVLILAALVYGGWKFYQFRKRGYKHA